MYECVIFLFTFAVFYTIYVLLVFFLFHVYNNTHLFIILFIEVLIVDSKMFKSTLIWRIR